MKAEQIIRRVLLSLFSLFIVGAGILFFLLRDPEGLTIDNPRFEKEDQTIIDNLMPRIMRYLSSLPGYEGKICFGLLLTAKDGIPTKVLNLTAVNPALGSSFSSFLSHDGFQLADEMFYSPSRESLAGYVETLSPENLEKIIKPPVDISMDELEKGERYIIGAGFNYSTHKEETASDVDKFLFPKFVAPTGAYEPVSLGTGGPLPGGTRAITDYEVEIGFVLLEEVDLSNPPRDRKAFLDRIAFFTANDVSDRWPVILKGDEGYTVSKSHPTYLPIGPWMVHGRYLNIRTRGGGEEEVRLFLRIDEKEPFPGGTWRQDASSGDMIRGPLEIIGMIAEIYAESRRPDREGVMRHVARQESDRVVIPAGSIILTGTTEGTAIEAPTMMDRARLIALGNLSMNKAKLAFALHCVKNRKEMGFLHVGDIVETRIQHLGKQRWEVQK